MVTDPKQPTESRSAEMHFAAVAECASLSEIERGEYCRRKGLYPKQITAWLQAFLNGMSLKKLSPRSTGSRPVRIRNLLDSLSVNCAARIRR